MKFSENSLTGRLLGENNNIIIFFLNESAANTDCSNNQKKKKKPGTITNLRPLANWSMIIWQWQRKVKTLLILKSHTKQHYLRSIPMANSSSIGLIHKRVKTAKKKNAKQFCPTLYFYPLYIHYTKQNTINSLISNRKKVATNCTVPRHDPETWVYQYISFG